MPSPKSRRAGLLVETAIGSIFCAITAAVLSLLMRDSAGRALLPLIFILVIVVAALRFGALASAIGTFIASLVFAYFLFTPVGSFRVQKPEARQSLLWMVMIGIPAGYFAWATRVDNEAAKKKSTDA